MMNAENMRTGQTEGVVEIITPYECFNFYPQISILKKNIENINPPHKFKFAIDVLKPNKNVVVKNYGSSLDINEFYDLYKTINNNNYMYELIESDTIRYEFYDMEYDFSEKNDTLLYKSPEDFFNIFNNIHTNFINNFYCSLSENEYDYMTKKPQWKITDSSKKGKFSLHLINKNRIFYNHKQFLFFYKFFLEYVKKFYPQYFGIFDKSVSSSSRAMRMLYASKYGQNRPLQKALWHTESKNADDCDFFIQNIKLEQQEVEKQNNLNNCVMLNIDKEQKKQKEKEKILEKKELYTEPYQLIQNEELQKIDDEFNSETNPPFYKIKKLISLISDCIILKKHSLCDGIIKDKICYEDLTLLSFAYLNACRNENLKDDEIFEFWEENIYSLYRHNQNYKSDNIWSCYFKSENKQNPLTIKSLHLWALENNQYFDFFTKPKVEYKTEPFDYYEDYYWGDFRREIESIEHKSYDDLKAFFILKFPKVCNVILKSEDEFYIKTETHKYEYCDKKPSFTVIYLEKNIKTNQIEKETIKFEKLYNDCKNDLNRYNNIVFEPYDINLEISSDEYMKRNIKYKKILNRFSGMKARLTKDYYEDDIQPILNHLNLVWCNNDPVKYKYILSWLAHIVQFPQDKTRTMLIIYSPAQQIGKGIIAEYLVNKIFGREISGKTSNIDNITGNFNAFAGNKIFITLDDLPYFEYQDKKTWETLKSFITEPTRTEQKKGVDVYDKIDYSNFLLLTNNIRACKLEKEDMRMVGFKCNESKKGDRKYFEDLAVTLNDDCIADQFYTFLYNYKIDIDIRKIPYTKEREEMCYHTLEQPLKFIEDIKNGDYKFTIHNKKYIKSADLFIHFNNWTYEKNERKDIYSLSKFEALIKNTLTKSKYRIDGKDSNPVACYDISCLSEYLTYKKPDVDDVVPDPDDDDVVVPDLLKK